MAKRLRFLFILLFPFINFGQHTDFPGIDFKKADSTAELYRGASLSDLQVLSYNLSHGLQTDVEKYRAIYLWLSQNVDNDFGLFQENQRMRIALRKKPKKLAEWNANFNKRIFKTLREGHKTVCTGYAYLLKEMCYFAGINCEIVNGYGRTSTANVEEMGIGNHSWNAVQLNNKWYLSDPTWSAGAFYIFSGLKVFTADYNNGYFLCPPEHFFLNHYPLQKRWPLLDSSFNEAKFLYAPLVYGAAFKYGLYPSSEMDFHLELKVGESLILDFEVKDTLNWEKLYFELYTENKVLSFNPDDLQLENNLLSLKTSFSKGGAYDLHLKLGEEYLCSFTVKVKS